MRTYGAASSLHVLQLPTYCSDSCCQLFNGQRVAQRRELACSLATDMATDDVVAKRTCAAAVEAHRAEAAAAAAKGLRADA